MVGFWWIKRWYFSACGIHAACSTSRKKMAVDAEFFCAESKARPQRIAFQLILSEFLYQSWREGGLEILHLDTHLQHQRLQLLLQFTRDARVMDMRNWTTAGFALLQLLLPHTGGRNALDFLTISSFRHGEMIT